MRPGYKLTEVGVIPEDWRTVAATDIVDPNAKTIDSLQRIELPAGVDIEIKIQNS